MTDSDIINKLGGVANLARRLSVSPSTAGNWPSRGIPWRHRTTVAEMAVVAGIAIPADFCKRRAS